MTFNKNQTISYPDPSAVDAVVQELMTLPPLVTVNEILMLKNQLAEAALGQRFLLQTGDCAERFQPDTTKEQINILNTLKTHLASQNKPIICVGRIAGQYAKPRTYETETKNGLTLPIYRGDLINQIEFTLKARTPNPARMLEGYHCAAKAIQLIPKHLYTSHEALLLYYEQAFTRVDSSGIHYNLSTHFPWCGMRTTSIHSAQIDYLSHIANPIALKIGPHISPSELLQLLDKLNPQNEPGRITLIHRLGAALIEARLPILIQALKTHGKTVLWSCDPMHGNTTITSDGTKMRLMQDIKIELQLAFNIHQSLSSYLGGVHLELSTESNIECVDNAEPAPDVKSVVDPRLTQQQALELMSIIQSQITLKNPASLVTSTPY